MGKARQDDIFPFLLVLFSLLFPGRVGLRPFPLLVQVEISEEPRDGPRRTEQAGTRRKVPFAGGRLAEDVDGGLLELRGRHLGGDETVPDQLVQTVLVAVEDRLYPFWGGLHRRRGESPPGGPCGRPGPG